MDTIPTSPTSFDAGFSLRLGRFRSLLLTASLLITFPAVTKTFQFTAFAILTDSVVTHIRVSLVQNLLAVRQGLLQLATPFVAEEAKPSTDQCLFRIIFLFLNSFENSFGSFLYCLNCGSFLPMHDLMNVR